MPLGRCHDDEGFSASISGSRKFSKGVAASHEQDKPSDVE